MIYKLVPGGVIGPVGFIPEDLDNTDYAEYLLWQSNGNTPAIDATPVGPSPVAVRLAEIDEAAKLTPRAFRELVILVAEGFKMATGGSLDLKATVPGVAQVFTLEEEAVALREQLTKD
jgi:hypothetical protein